MTSPIWHALTVRGGGYSPLVAKEAKGASGAYAIRRASDHEVVYVGSAARGTLWKTLIRHFHAAESFKALREGFVVSSPVGWDVALEVTSRGARPRAGTKRAAKGGGAKDADQRASAAEQRWIRTLHPTKNKDDAGAGEDTARELRELRAKQEEEDRGFGSLLNPDNSSAEKTAHQWGFFDALEGRPSQASKKRAVRRGVFMNLTPSLRASYERGFAAGDEAAQRTPQKNPGKEPALVQLGLLTRLDLGRGRVLRWSLKDAPILAYDPSLVAPGGACLVIAYRDGKVCRTSTEAECEEYRAKHWGAVPIGHVRCLGRAVGPYKSLGPSVAITYTTKKGLDSKLVDYVHPWGEGASRRCIRPIVEEHACGKGCGARCAARGAIRLTGGTYSLENRGIVG